MKELAATQVVFVCTNTLRWNLPHSLFFFLRQHDLEGVDDARRNLILNREHVFHLAIISLRPQLEACRDIDELRRDAQAIACLAHASFENSVHFELSTNRADVFLVALEG